MRNLYKREKNNGPLNSLLTRFDRIFDTLLIEMRSFFIFKNAQISTNILLLRKMSISTFDYILIKLQHVLKRIGQILLTTFFTV